MYFPLGGKVHPNTVVLTIKWTTCYIYGRICTMTTLGRVENTRFLLSACVLIHVELLGFLSLAILSMGNSEFKPRIGPV